MDKKKSHATFSFYYIFLVEIHRFLELTPSLLEHNHVRHLKVIPTFKKNRRNNRRDSNEIPNSIYTCVMKWSQ